MFELDTFKNRIFAIILKFFFTLISNIINFVYFFVYFFKLPFFPPLSNIVLFALFGFMQFNIGKSNNIFFLISLCKKLIFFLT